ncbi:MULTISPECIES: hypothetical protein [Enterobacter cloacae complex]|uniref:Uncharacterized protein n=1 Tax=Enterobacter hormaechei TaxID=158836 RepID=A0A6G4MN87_9ENTR|nr:hypothetical protein [Enterobacter hormaechei]EMD6796110.1 hypothetical protein [Enterobacter hormaechei subsp. steigerwaltii]HCM9152943.1 hypothetical protein [Enterobacter cloacae subsp. cloacae]EJR0238841.1 hypothetical protein [Enterobacter hormaechei]EKT9343523.1 hypothetical protein [Enterobacter hormaechei]EKT9370209.1 hypothetical protein [Enterobacter hormaechei]
MRDRTRSYTTDLPRIGLPFLTHMRSRLADAEPATQIYTQTESGTLYTFRQADSYAMTINGVTRVIRTTTTQAGYGVREWYVCPHCVKRVAKLYIGPKDIACRECWRLHYKSQSGDKLDRMRMSIRRQRYAIWGDGEQFRNLFNHPNTFPKPKGMRWVTFERKLAWLILYEAAYWRAFSPVVDKITGRMR